MSEQLLPVLIAASVRATVLALLVGALLAVLRIRSGATRHAAWLAVAVAMLLMPVLPRFVPGVPIELPRQTFFTPLVAPATMAVPAPTLPAPVPQRSAATQRSAAPRRGAVGSTPEAPPVEVLPAFDAMWLRALLVFYGLVVAAMLLRLAAGAWIARSLLQQSTPIAAGLRESPWLATPVTVGAFRPEVLLPASWREWPDATRQAALAHERAHAARRDPLGALLARLNRCVFWFHPLAWWLERAVARAAEQACDDAAIRAVGQPREYAEVLLAMAGASQRAGGRISWAAVGVDGDAPLGRRIDRILSGDTAATTRTRQWILAAGCVAAVAVVVACRSSQPVAPLVDERGQAAEAARQKFEGDRAERRAARALTWKQAAELEARWRGNPEDLRTLETLLEFYAPDPQGRRLPEDARKMAGRRPLVLWAIEHQPGNSRLMGRRASLSWVGRDDATAYAEAKKIWLSHAAKPDVRPEVLGHAAEFFNDLDRPLAGQMLQQASRIDPAQWTYTLGAHYARVLTNDRPWTHDRSAQKRYADQVTAELTQSTNPRLVAATGDMLRYQSMGSSESMSPEERRRLARQLFDHALVLDPGNRVAVRGIGALERPKMPDPVLAVPPEARPAVIAALPESERLRPLARMAGSDYFRAEYYEWIATHPQDDEQKNPAAIAANRAAAKAEWQRSKAYAEQLVALAERLPGHPNAPDALFSGHVALGAHAFRAGDRQTALKHLMAAAATPEGERRITIDQVTLEDRLVRPLLKYGERETIIEYFERSATNRPADRERLLAAAAAIRNGRQPATYMRY
jgi:beta-lactamase regulating signal transducer with metallopeptidase domain